MDTQLIALFGEAEKGAFHKGVLCSTLPQLEDYFGHPPEGTLGLYFAIQALLYDYKLIFFRVEQEGFSTPDYIRGFDTLASSDLIKDVLAIGIPGVGDIEVLDAAKPLIDVYHQILITTERDFYDLCLSNCK